MFQAMKLRPHSALKIVSGKGRRMALSAMLALALPAAHAAGLDVVMSDLSNPRGLTFGPAGSLYVAEAGRSGDGPTVDTATGPQSYGNTGAVSVLRDGVQGRFATGLPSLAPADGVEATGPHDLAFDTSGRLNLSIGLGANPAVRSGGLSGKPNASLMGQVARLDSQGRPQALTDIAGREASANPGGGIVDTNAYGLAPRLGGGLGVADAGANAAYRLDENGAITDTDVFASRANPRFPALGPPRYETVPTGVAVGPNGDIFVAELNGFPFIAGEARVWRLDGSNPSGAASLRRRPYRDCGPRLRPQRRSVCARVR